MAGGGQEADLDQDDIAELCEQGLCYDDAVAALLLSEGDVEEALVRAATCAELGGAAKTWLEMTQPDMSHPEGGRGGGSSSSSSSRRQQQVRLQPWPWQRAALMYQVSVMMRK
jgi:hypothetical protein